jgi:hypothetical protein
MFGILSITLHAKYTGILGTKGLKEGVSLFEFHATMILAQN